MTHDGDNRAHPHPPETTPWVTDRVRLFTRAGCGLCQGVLYVLRRVQRSFPFELEVVDIEAPGQEAWRQAYGEHIPVVHLNGREIARHRLDEKTLRTCLEEEARKRRGRDENG